MITGAQPEAFTAHHAPAASSTTSHHNSSNRGGTQPGVKGGQQVGPGGFKGWARWRGVASAVLRVAVELGGAAAWSAAGAPGQARSCMAR